MTCSWVGNSAVVVLAGVQRAGGSSRPQEGVDTILYLRDQDGFGVLSGTQEYRHIKKTTAEYFVGRTTE